MESPQLGANPLDAFVETREHKRELFNQPNALDRPVDHPLGRLTAERFLASRACRVRDRADRHMGHPAMPLGRRLQSELGAVPLLGHLAG